jgi:hypothetical protein
MRLYAGRKIASVIRNPCHQAKRKDVLRADSARIIPSIQYEVVVMWLCIKVQSKDCIIERHQALLSVVVICWIIRTADASPLVHGTIAFKDLCLLILHGVAKALVNRTASASVGAESVILESARLEVTERRIVINGYLQVILSNGDTQAQCKSC